MSRFEKFVERETARRRRNARCRRITFEHRKVDRRTLYRWRKDEEFLEILNARRREVWGDLVGRLRDLTQPSLEVMAEHLEDRYDRARFRAAALILRLAHLHKHAEGME